MKLPDRFEILIPIAIEAGKREGVLTYGNLQRYLHISFELSTQIIDFLLEHKVIFKEDPKIPAWKLNELEAFLMLDRIIHEREWQKYTGTRQLTREDAIKILKQTKSNWKKKISDLF